MPETAFAPIIMKVAPTPNSANDFEITLITQAEPGFIPEGGIGRAYHKDFLPKAQLPAGTEGSGAAAPPDTTTDDPDNPPYKITVSAPRYRT